MASEVVRSAAGKPQVRKANKAGKLGWTATKRDVFLEHLRVSCNVAASCRKAMMRDTVVYKKRSTDAAFRASWAAAIGEAVERLEMMLLERALKGTKVERRSRDGAVTTTVVYPDQVALALIRAHKPQVEAFAEPDDEEEIAALRARIARKLDAVAKRQREGGRLGPQAPGAASVAAIASPAAGGAAPAAGGAESDA